MTRTLEEARAHARSQATTAKVDTMATMPPSSAENLRAGVDPSAVLWDEVLPAGGYRGQRLPRGATLRIEDDDGDGCVHLVAHNAHQPTERLNVADTVKVQWQAYLGTGAQLLSDMGRVLLTITADTSGRHDALCGCTNLRTNEAKYGPGRGGLHGDAPNGRDLLSLALVKLGLQRRDLAFGVNLFKGVAVTEDGSLVCDVSARPHTFVEMRAEMDLFVALANSPHPLDPRPSYTASPVRVTAWRSDAADMRCPAGRTDSDTDERRRAIENTEAFLLGVA